MEWLYAVLWLLGIGEKLAGSPTKRREPTTRDRLNEYLSFCDSFRGVFEFDVKDRRVLAHAQEQIAQTLAAHDALRAAVSANAASENAKTRRAAERSAADLLAQAQLVYGQYTATSKLIETDRSAAMNAEGDLVMAGYRVRELDRYKGDNEPFRQRLSEAWTLYKSTEFARAAQLAVALTIDCERERYVRAWRDSLKELASWRGADGDASGLAAYAVMPDVVASTRAEELLAPHEPALLDPIQTVLAVATCERVIGNNSCAGRWQHFVYPRMPDHGRVAKLAQGRAAYAAAHFGASSPERLSALMSFARACEEHGRLFGVPGFMATSKERKEKQAWELAQYDQAFATALEALAIADTTFGIDDPRTRRIVFLAAFTTRRQDYPIDDGLRARLQAERDDLYKKK